MSVPRTVKIVFIIEAHLLYVKDGLIRDLFLLEFQQGFWDAE